MKREARNSDMESRPLIARMGPTKPVLSMVSVGERACFLYACPQHMREGMNDAVQPEL